MKKAMIWLMRNIFWPIVFLIVIVLFIVLFLCFPDFLFFLREKISFLFEKILRFTVSGNNIASIDYINVIIEIFNGFMTAFLAAMAYMLSKRLGKIETDDEKALKMLWATKLCCYVKENLQLINSIVVKGYKHQIISLNEDEDDEYLKYIINLHSKGLINDEERNIIQDIRNDIIVIKNQYIENNPNILKIAEEISKKYYAEIYTAEKYTDTMKLIIQNLHTISDRGEKNV